ncbi:hypothetical protein GCM10020001_015660 [Nonomuraea salmonea]
MIPRSAVRDPVALGVGELTESNAYSLEGTFAVFRSVPKTATTADLDMQNLRARRQRDDHEGISPRHIRYRLGRDATGASGGNDHQGAKGAEAVRLGLRRSSR